MKFTNIFLMAFLLVLASCSNPKSFDFKGIKSIQLEKASFGKNLVNANFEYYNPNNFGLTLKQLDCIIYINDQALTEYHLHQDFIIPASSNFELPAKMEIELSKLLKNSVDILMNNPMKVEVKGNATLTKGFFTKQVPIAFKTEQKLNLKEALKSMK